MTEFLSIQRQIIIYLITLILLLAVNTWIGNLIVRRVVRGMPGAPDNSSGVSAGTRVGILERLLVFLLILVGQWGVIGFVITAKSIARFKELENKAFTEYYLAGTFTSILVASLVGLTATWVRGLLWP